MKLSELEHQVLQLPLSERWRLVKFILTSIQQETNPPETQEISSQSAIKHTGFMTNIDPWTQSFVGIIQLDSEDLTEDYTNYLEEKYYYLRRVG